MFDFHVAFTYFSFACELPRHCVLVYPLQHATYTRSSPITMEYFRQMRNFLRNHCEWFFSFEHGLSRRKADNIFIHRCQPIQLIRSPLVPRVRKSNSHLLLDKNFIQCLDSMASINRSSILAIEQYREHSNVLYL